MIMKRYYVYALIKNTKPVYVGCSSNLSVRRSQHLRTKDFDKLIVIESFRDKKHALICERAIVKFITLFGEGDTYNAEYIHHAFIRETVIKA